MIWIVKIVSPLDWLFNYDNRYLITTEWFNLIINTPKIVKNILWNSTFSSSKSFYYTDPLILSTPFDKCRRIRDHFAKRSLETILRVHLRGSDSHAYCKTLSRIIFGFVTDVGHSSAGLVVAYQKDLLFFPEIDFLKFKRPTWRHALSTPEKANFKRSLNMKLTNFHILISSVTWCYRRFYLSVYNIKFIINLIME